MCINNEKVNCFETEILPCALERYIAGSVCVREGNGVEERVLCGPKVVVIDKSIYAHPSMIIVCQKMLREQNRKNKVCLERVVLSQAEVEELHSFDFKLSDYEDPFDDLA